MKTTRTAQYAADAANNSCRSALVRRDIAAENRRVKTIRTPMAEKAGDAVRKLASRYIAITGRTRRTNMMHVMSRPTSFSTRDAE
jgi:hypothetical protein